jgi:hypothetical protein
LLSRNIVPALPVPSNVEKATISITGGMTKYETSKNETKAKNSKPNPDNKDRSPFRHSGFFIHSGIRVSSLFGHSSFGIRIASTIQTFNIQIRMTKQFRNPNPRMNDE